MIMYNERTDKNKCKITAGKLQKYYVLKYTPESRLQILDNEKRNLIEKNVYQLRFLFKIT